MGTWDWNVRHSYGPTPLAFILRSHNRPFTHLIILQTRSHSQPCSLQLIVAIFLHTIKYTSWGLPFENSTQETADLPPNLKKQQWSETGKNLLWVDATRPSQPWSELQHLKQRRSLMAWRSQPSSLCCYFIFLSGPLWVCFCFSSFLP